MKIQTQYRIKEYLGVFEIQMKVKRVVYRFDYFPWFGKAIEDWSTLIRLGTFKDFDSCNKMVGHLLNGPEYHAVEIGINSQTK